MSAIGVVVAAWVIYSIIKAGYWSSLPDSVKQAQWEAQEGAKQRAGEGGLKAGLITAALMFGSFFAIMIYLSSR